MFCHYWVQRHSSIFDIGASVIGLIVNMLRPGVLVYVCLHVDKIWFGQVTRKDMFYIQTPNN